MKAGRVTKVRLFSDRAAVTRTIEVAIEPGLKDLEVGPLPVHIDPGTLRASAALVNGDAASRQVPVTSVSSQPSFDAPADDRRSAVTQELQEIESRLASMADAENTEAHAASMLTRYAEIVTDKLSAEWLDSSPSFDKWASTFDHLRKTRAKLAAARASRLQERRRLQEKRADLLEEDHRLGRPEQSGFRVSITVDLPEDAAGRLRVRLTYVTRRARWSPAYDVRHFSPSNSKPERVVLTGIALVDQSTGEDWEDVELVATTARPPLATPPPELAKLVVSGHLALANGGTRPRDNGEPKPRLYAAPPLGTTRATVENAADGKVSVPSGPRPVRVVLFSEELLARSRVEILPRERPTAMLVVEVMNRSNRVLLPGRVNLFRGSDYFGQAILGFVSGGERFRLPYGHDEALRVRRRSIARPNRSAIVGAINHDFEVKTTVDNVDDTAREVVVRERVPVSRTADASVKLLGAERGQQVDPDTGLSELTLTIPPHTRREVVTAFRVTAPAGFDVVPPKEP